MPWGTAEGGAGGPFRKLPGRHRVTPGRPYKGHVADGVEWSQYRGSGWPEFRWAHSRVGVDPGGPTDLAVHDRAR